MNPEETFAETQRLREIENVQRKYPSLTEGDVVEIDEAADVFAAFRDALVARGFSTSTADELTVAVAEQSDVL